MTHPTPKKRRHVFTPQFQPLCVIILVIVGHLKTAVSANRSSSAPGRPNPLAFSFAGVCRSRSSGSRIPTTLFVAFNTRDVGRDITLISSQGHSNGRRRKRPFSRFPCRVNFSDVSRLAKARSDRYRADEAEDEDEYEYARVRRGRRGERRYNEDDSEFDGSPSEEKFTAGASGGRSRYYDDEIYEDDYYYDEDLMNEGQREKKRPLALDMADPGRTHERWGELLTDWGLIRDLAILAIIWGFVEFLDQWPQEVSPLPPIP